MPILTALQNLLPVCVYPDQPVTSRSLSKNPEKEGHQVASGKEHCETDKVPNVVPLRKSSPVYQSWN